MKLVWTSISTLTSAFVKNRSGAAAIEYALIAAALSVVIIASVSSTGGQTSDTFNKVASAVDGTGSADGSGDSGSGNNSGSGDSGSGSGDNGTGDNGTGDSGDGDKSKKPKKDKKKKDKKKKDKKKDKKKK